MLYKVDNLVRDVRVCLDENIVSESLITEADRETLSLEDIIRSKIAEGVQRVHQEAPTHMLELGHSFGDDVFWMDEGSGYVWLPEDFMRLVSFKMSDWTMAVTEPISQDDALYQLQRQPIKGLRGNTVKPVCAIVMRPERKVLEFYSSKNNLATVERANYMPWPKINNGAIDISEKCKDAAVYTTAALTLITFSENERAKSLSELAKSLIS